jgi:hypothetical protein
MAPMLSPDNITILIDSREQRALAFAGFETQRVTLATGDYSCIADGQSLRHAGRPQPRFQHPPIHFRHLKSRRHAATFTTIVTATSDTLH